MRARGNGEKRTFRGRRIPPSAGGVGRGSVSAGVGRRETARRGSTPGAARVARVDTRGVAAVGNATRGANARAVDGRGLRTPLGGKRKSIVRRRDAGCDADPDAGAVAAAAGSPRAAARLVVSPTAHLKLEQDGEDTVAQLGEEGLHVGVPPLQHLLDAFLVHRQADLRLVEDLSHARDGHRDERRERGRGERTGDARARVRRGEARAGRARRGGNLPPRRGRRGENERWWSWHETIDARCRQQFGTPAPGAFLFFS